MKINKLVLSILFLIPLFFAYQTDSVKAANTFSDVGSKHRAYNQISYLAQGGIITAEDTSNKFYPGKYVTRAEVVTWIGKALNLNGKATNSKFKDVSTSHPAAGYIQSAVNEGIISGYPDGTFKPDTLVKRGEMALFISRAFDYGETKDTTKAIGALKTFGIAQGYTNGSFGVTDKIIRADFAVFLARAIDYKQRITPNLPLSGEVKYVSPSELNVRTGPSTKYASINKLSKGAKVQIAYQVGNWTVVKNGSVIGFVSSSYLINQQPVETPTPVPNPPISGEKSLSGLKLAIDPGHGGKDPGASGYGLKEKDVVLDTGLRLQTLLQSTPIQIIMTRDTDIYIAPVERAKKANAEKADLFVSIHANAANKTASGTETLYYPNSADSQKLAGYIQKRLVDTLDTKDRKLKPRKDLAVLNSTNMTAVLVEIGFIDQVDDNALLADPAKRQEAAQAIYNGILDYYKSEGYEVNSYYK